MAKYVRRGGPKPRKSKLLIFLNILIGAALVIILIEAAVLIDQNNSGGYYNRQFEEGYSFRNIERGNYADIVEQYYSDWGVLGQVKAGSEEAAAVADYADAAFRLNAYERTDGEDAAVPGAAGKDNAVSAGKLRERMQADREKMGIYLPEADKIDRKLGGKAE